MILNMIKGIIVLFIFVGIVFAAKELFGDKVKELKEKKKSPYSYKKKQFFMTGVEHKFHDTLIEGVGHKYYVFPQVHLSSIIDNKVVGQNWKAAFSHINGKSVDFVLCDKEYIAPRLAIELDDRSHEREDRKERDTEVERILEEAGLPLLRIENHGSFNAEDIREKINEILK